MFNVPSTARSFRDGTPIYCPLRRTWSSINTPFRPGIEPRAVAWESITLPLRCKLHYTIKSSLNCDFRIPYNWVRPVAHGGGGQTVQNCLYMYEWVFVCVLNLKSLNENFRYTLKWSFSGFENEAEQTFDRNCTFIRLFYHRFSAILMFIIEIYIFLFQ